MARNLYLDLHDSLIAYRIKQLKKEKILYNTIESEIKDLEVELRGILTSNSKRTKRELLLLLLVLAERKFTSLNVKMIDELKKAAKSNSTTLHKLVQQVTKDTGQKFTKLTPEEVDKLWKHHDDGWDFEERFNSVVREFNASIHAISNRIEKKETDFPLVLGALATASRKAQRETAIRFSNQYTNIMSQTTLAYGRINAPYIRFVKFVAILDSRTSDICRGFSGRIFDLIADRGKIPIPKLHPHCRSELVPVFDLDAFDVPDSTKDKFFVDASADETLAAWIARTGNNTKI